MLDNPIDDTPPCTLDFPQVTDAEPVECDRNFGSVFLAKKWAADFVQQDPDLRPVITVTQEVSEGVNRYIVWSGYWDGSQLVWRRHTIEPKKLAVETPSVSLSVQALWDRLQAGRLGFLDLHKVL